PFSHGLRRAYEHEPIGQLRLNREEVTEVEEPRLACLLSGTPDQLLGLLPNAEDGLFSRFLFHHTHGFDGWLSGRPREEDRAFEGAVERLADVIHEAYAALEGREASLEVEWSDAQWDLHTAVFDAIRRWADGAGVPDEFTASIHRAGAMAFRIAMVLAVLRRADGGLGLAGAEQIGRAS